MNMLKLNSTTILIFFISILSFHNLEAQNNNSRVNNKSSLKEGGKFSDNLWFGGGINLGFASSANASLFSFGLAPMVGYKFTPDFSIGPRVGFTFSNYKYKFGSKVDNIALFDFSEGLFARYKFFNVVFAHVEYDFTQKQVEDLDFNGNLIKYSVYGSDAFVGLGYNSGDGGFGTEIYILYNLLAESNTLSQPFEFRIGLTYNF